MKIYQLQNHLTELYSLLKKRGLFETGSEDDMRIENLLIQSRGFVSDIFHAQGLVNITGKGLVRVIDRRPKENEYFVEINSNGCRASYEHRLYQCIGDTGNFILSKDINVPFRDDCYTVLEADFPIDGVKLTSFNISL